MPVSATVCGLAGALSVTTTVPVRVLIVVGVNVTLMVQLALTATLVPQLFVCEKSPVVAMLVIVRTAAPVFVRVTFCGVLAVPTNWVGKVRLVGDRVTAGPLPSPTPVSVVVSGLFGALSVTVTVAFSVPAIDGVNVTLIAQVACGATLPDVQVLVSLKSLPLAPLIPTEVTVRFELPVLVTVIVMGALVVPSFTFPKLSPGDSPTFGLAANFVT